MLTISTLENSTSQEILSCFNLSFSDYFVPVQRTLEQIESKLDSENINLKYSVGAYKDSKLIGIILHGIREVINQKIAYNAGTGVIPDERGNNLTERMYDYILPQLISEDFNEVVLEVITKNIPAIKSYEKCGFKLGRQLNCYKGKLQGTETNKDITISQIYKPKWETLNRLGEIEPTWQSSNETIENLGEAILCLGAYYDRKLCGYCALNKENNRIMQLAVTKDMRNKKIGTSFLGYVKNKYGAETTMINVDDSYKSINAFLERRGLTNFIQQYEMKLDLINN